jgi:hypothetical protein
MEPGNNDGWDVFIEGTEAYVKAMAEREQRQALEAEKCRLEEQERLKKQKLENEARAKAWQDAQAKARAEKQAYVVKMNRLVESGDLETLMAELADDLQEPFPEERVWVAEDRYRKAMGWLTAGIESAAQRNPEKFVSFVGAKILAFNAMLLLRSQTAAMGCIRIYDRDPKGPNGELPQAVVEKWLPRITALQHAIEASALVFAKVKHTAKLGSKNAKGRKENGHRPDHGAGDGSTREQRPQPGNLDSPGTAEAPGGSAGRTPAAGKSTVAA